MCKVTDFGMARDVQQESIYERKTKVLDKENERWRQLLGYNFHTRCVRSIGHTHPVQCVCVFFLINLTSWISKYILNIIYCVTKLLVMVLLKYP